MLCSSTFLGSSLSIVGRHATTYACSIHKELARKRAISSSCLYISTDRNCWQTTSSANDDDSMLLWQVKKSQSARAWMWKWNKSIDKNASFTFFYSFIFFSDNNQLELQCGTGTKASTRMHHSLFSIRLFSSQTTISQSLNAELEQKHWWECIVYFFLFVYFLLRQQSVTWISLL